MRPHESGVDFVFFPSTDRQSRAYVVCVWSTRQYLHRGLPSHIELFGLPTFCGLSSKFILKVLRTYSRIISHRIIQRSDEKSRPYLPATPAAAFAPPAMRRDTSPRRRHFHMRGCEHRRCQRAAASCPGCHHRAYSLAAAAAAAAAGGASPRGEAARGRWRRRC